MPPPIINETEGLLSFLAHQRQGLRVTAFGLTNEQLRACPSASSLSIGGLLKHTVAAERYWISQVVLGEADQGGAREYAAQFTLTADETIASLLADQAKVAARTEETVRRLADLDHPVPVPDGPWFPQDVTAWSLRWVLMHLIEEISRHCGHADIVRETIDGATQFELLAADQGWPATPWLKPWAPKVAD